MAPSGISRCKFNAALDKRRGWGVEVLNVCVREGEVSDGRRVQNVRGRQI